MELEEKIQIIEDKMAIKQLVDTFTLLEDEKNAAAQKMLFTNDSLMKIFINGQEVMNMNGPAEIEAFYQKYYNSFETIFHINGQQVLNLKGDRAIGRSYSQATIVEEKNGQKEFSQEGMYYDDEFRKTNGHWQFVRRTCHIVWKK